MDIKANDYSNYDKLNLFIKDKKIDNIIEIYTKLGYEIVSVEPNKRYSNIVDVTLVRKHKIKNKDKMQYLQANLEIGLNKIGKIEKNKYSLSLAVGLTLGIFSFISIILGVYFLLNNLNNSEKLGFIILIVFGCALIVLCCTIVPIIVKKEKIKFIKNINKEKAELEKLIDEIGEINKNDGKVTQGESKK